MKIKITIEKADAGLSSGKVKVGGINMYQASSVPMAVATRPPIRPPTQALRNTVGIKRNQT